MVRPVRPGDALRWLFHPGRAPSDSLSCRNVAHAPAGFRLVCLQRSVLVVAWFYTRRLLRGRRVELFGAEYQLQNGGWSGIDHHGFSPLLRSYWCAAQKTVEESRADIEMLSFHQFWAALRWQNIVDFFVLTVAIYLVLRWGKDARAFRVSLGIVVLRACALLARQLDLVITGLVLDATNLIAVILLLIVFQSELRHA